MTSKRTANADRCYRIAVRVANTNDFPLTLCFKKGDLAANAVDQLTRKGFKVETFLPVTFTTSTADALTRAAVFFGRD